MSYFVEMDLVSSGTIKLGEISIQTASGNILKYIKSVSEITRAINQNKSFENSTATIVFHNVRGYFDELMKGPDRFIKGIVIRIYDDNILIFTGKIYDTPPCDPDEFEILADSKTYGLEKIINKKIKKSEFSNASDDNAGKYSNIIFGTASDSGGNNTGILTAYRIDTNKFIAAWHHCDGFRSPFTGTQVYDKDENNITGSCTFTNDGDGNAYINYTSADNEIFFNTKGFIDDDLNFIENPAEQLKYINLKYGVFTFDSIESAENVYSSRNYLGSCIGINDGFTWQQFFQRFSINFDCFIFQKVTGNLGIKVLDWGTEYATHNIKEMYVDEKTFQGWRDMSEIINEYQRMYWYHFRKNFFHRLPSDIEASTGWEAEEQPLDLRYHSDDTTVIDVSIRTIYFKKNPIIFYKFSIPKSIGNKIELADVLNLRYRKGYYPFAWRLTLVLRKTYKQGTNMVFFEGMDITGINDGLIRLWLDDDSNIVNLLDESHPDCHVLL